MGNVYKENVIISKSFKFAVRVYKLSKYLEEQKREYILSKQLLKSGTSIGANVREASVAQTTKDFYAKMSIAFKECKETQYWLELLLEVGCIDDNQAKSILNECEELCKIISSIRKSIREKLKNMV